jgi:hypothetical protein
MDVVDRIAQSPSRSVRGFPQLPWETVLLESAARIRKCSVADGLRLGRLQPPDPGLRLAYGLEAFRLPVA